MGTNRPLNSDGDVYTDPVTYNPYDKGHKSGAQASLFIGPIWVEEVVSVRLGTGTSDVPIYPYSTPYHNSLLLGNYLVEGQIGINYTESDYLLRIIEAARSASIQEDELKQIIKGRKSLFEDTLKLKENSDFANKRIHSYVERISREIETSSMNSKGKLDPRTFELTIIIGNLYDSNQAIEIYEDVKIIRTNKIVDNGDNTLLEIYDFVGKKKPDRLTKIEVETEPNYLSKTNLLSMAQEVINQLMDSIIRPPSIAITDTKIRTEEMLSTDKLAVSGFLTSNTRCYGKKASFSEILYDFEIPAMIKTYQTIDGDVAEKEIRSDTKLKIYKDGDSTGVEKDIYLTYPSDKEYQGFNNLGGKLAFPDREGCSKHIAAIAPIAAVQTLHRIGGSVSLPRYSMKEFGVGSYYPPGIVDLETFDYTDSEIKNLTYGTLWCSTLGFRSSIASKEINSPDTEGFISTITQPVNTLSLLEYPSGTWSASDSSFTLKLPIPRTVDFVKTNKGKFRTNSEMEVGMAGNFLTFTMTKGTGNYLSSPDDSALMEGSFAETCKDASDKISSIDKEYNERANAGESVGPKYVPEIAVNNTELYEKTFIQVYHQKVEVPEGNGIVPISGEPNFIRMNLTTGSEKIAATIQKSLYAIPLVFIDQERTLSVSLVDEDYVGTETATVLSGSTTIESYFADVESGKKAAEYLAWYLQKKGGRDDSCSVEIEYDFVLTNQQGYFNHGQPIQIDGVYFLNDIGGKSDLINASDGSVQSRRELGYPLQVHVFWICGIIPNIQLPNGVNNDTSGIDIEHSIDSRSGRKLEIYNITRCDTRLHNGDFITSVSAGSQIWAAILNAFQELLNIDTITTTYTYPVKASWKQYAGFVNGYSVNIDIEELTTQVYKCSFTGDVLAELNNSAKEELDRTGNFTLRNAFRAAIGGDISKLTEEINGMIYSTLAIKAQEIGARITNNGESSVVNLDVEVLIPSVEIVKHGLTTEGFEELKAFTSLNTVESSNTVTIELGGYDV